VFVEEIPSSPGSVLQVRECAARLMTFCKEHQITCFVIGQVTKDGQVAGPRLLEHLVDTVLYLEGDSSMGFRMLRAMKNRFGSTGEIGVFSMTHRGLDDVVNPSALFLGEQGGAAASGSAVSVAVEGTRPFLLELQVLVGSATYASPRRIVSGLDSNRVAILVAMLEKRAGLNFSQNDVFASVAGGLRVSESAHDLALLSALISSHRDRMPPQRTCYFGELSLSGDVRAVPHALARVREARMRGFERIFLPKSCYEREKAEIFKVLRSDQDETTGTECELYPIANVGELLEHMAH
jgi:DNA repair protein RadA/Sms